MSDARRDDDALLAILKGLVVVVPAFGRWLAGLLDGADERPDFSRRVRDVLPARSASRAAAEELSR